MFSSPSTDRSETSAADVPCIPLFVDLDGTLIATDVLQESLFLAVKRDPWLLVRLPGLILKGRARLKRELSALVQPNPKLLPYRREVIEHIRVQRELGRPIVLATATDRVWADKVAAEVGLFDDVLASDGTLNLKGSRKLAGIQEYCRQRGYRGFLYLGDSFADLPIWRQAVEVDVVAPGRALSAAVDQLGKRTRVYESRSGRGRAILRVLRPQQWIKNLLLFAPLFLAHELSSMPKLLACVIGFIAFSACASAVYVLNDLFDIESDREHSIKRKRPFAAGQLPVAYGPALILGLLSFAAVVSWVALPPLFLGALAGYVGLNCLYSLWLKRKLAMDVVLLAVMYALRVVVGGIAADVAVSEWLLAFSLFLFTSLAFAKRYDELARLPDVALGGAKGRGYTRGDLSMIESLGPTSGYLSVLVLALYVNSENMKKLYAQPWALWAICPLMLYWITRVWFAVRRGEIREDPLAYAVKDRVSLMVGLAVVALATIATKF